MITSVFEIAAKVSTPLALSGLTLAVLFFIFRQLLAKNIFPELARATGGALLRQIVDRLFVLALVAMFLGTAGYLLPLLAPRVARSELPSTAAAETVLSQLYSGKYQELYDSLSPELRSQIPFAAFLTGVKKQMSQFSAPPLYRRLSRTQTVAGYCYYTFEAEFDQRSRFREILTYADTPTGWLFLRFDLYPTDWPLPSVAAPLPESTASALFQRLEKLEPLQLASFLNNEVVGHWIPAPGWSGRFEKILSQEDTRTCDIQLRESSTGALLTARDVLDGCTLKEAKYVTLFGRVDKASNRSAEISSVRWFLN